MWSSWGRASLDKQRCFIDSKLENLFRPRSQKRLRFALLTFRRKMQDYIFLI